MRRSTPSKDPISPIRFRCRGANIGRCNAAVAVSILFLGFAATNRAHPASGPQVADADVCEAAIAAVPPSPGMPPNLLHAIGVVESGRPDPGTGRYHPWPWTVNVEGRGHLFATKADAIAAVRAAQAVGKRSIDVGCMQINLMYHPAAFATLDDAFDPQLNVAYADAFLVRLHTMSNDWRQAAADYHSQTPQIGTAYIVRVFGEKAPLLMAVASDSVESAMHRRVPSLGLFPIADEGGAQQGMLSRTALADVMIDKSALAGLGLVPEMPLRPQFDHAGRPHGMARAARVALAVRPD